MMRVVDLNVLNSCLHVFVVGRQPTFGQHTSGFLAPAVSCFQQDWNLAILNLNSLRVRKESTLKYTTSMFSFFAFP